MNQIQTIDTQLLAQTKRFLILFKKLPEIVIKSHNNCSIFSELGVITDEVEDFDIELVSIALKDVFPDVEKFNNSFWNSFSDVSKKSQEELWFEAAKHYLSTYGVEALGLEADEVYLPEKVLDINPRITKFKVIGSVSYQESKEKILSLFKMNIGLSYRTIDAAIQELEYRKFEFSKDFIESIVNKEMKTYVEYKTEYIPESAEESLRLINYIFTNNTQFIKSKEVMDRWILNSDILTTDKSDGQYIEKLVDSHIIELSEVYYRYKKFILQLKHISKHLSKSINKISRLAKENWKPYSENKFVTTKVLFTDIDINQIKKQLNEFDIFTLVKIYNKLNYSRYVEISSSNVYTIRNGKVFIKENQYINKEIDTSRIGEICSYIKRLLQQRLDKRYLIKNHGSLECAFPTSEKRFIGDIPFNSIAKFDNASVIGISWKNLNKQRVDLDLSIITEFNEKYGWNSSYRNQHNTFIYSGDMTSEGAESFYVNEHNIKSLLYVNAFNCKNVDFDFFLSNEEKDVWKKEYHRTVNLDKIIYSSKLSIDSELIIGVYDGCNSFAFTGFQGSQSNVSNINYSITQHLEDLLNQAKYSLKLSDVFGNYDELFIAYCEENKDFNEVEAKYLFDSMYQVVDLENPNKSDILEMVKE